MEVPEEVRDYDIAITDDAKTGYKLIKLVHPPGIVRDHADIYCLQLRAKELGGGRWFVQRGDVEKIVPAVMYMDFARHWGRTPETAMSEVMRRTNPLGVNRSSLKYRRGLYLVLSVYGQERLRSAYYRKISSRNTDADYYVHSRISQVYVCPNRDTRISSSSHWLH